MLKKLLPLLALVLGLSACIDPVTPTEVPTEAPTETTAPTSTTLPQKYNSGDPNSAVVEGNLLFDYYSANAGLPTDNLYEEYTIEEVDGALYFNHYLGNRDKGTTSYHAAYVGNQALLDAAMNTINAFGMPDWEDADGVGMSGHVYAVKFRDQDDRLVRISSDNMPEHGDSAFRAVESFLSQAKNELELIRVYNCDPPDDDPLDYSVPEE